jgi:predicted transcriptional regulator
VEQQLTTADVKEIFKEMIKKHLHEAVEQFIEDNKVKLKEIPVLERIVHSEEARK